MRRLQLSVGTLFVAAMAACNGDCRGNAVVVATEITHLAPIIDTIEVYEDKNEDGAFALSERAFVIQPAPSNKQKILKISFLLPVPRDRLVLPDPCETSPCPDSFLDFSSLVDPFPNPWVKSIQFDDGTDDVNGDPTTTVTYYLYDDLVYQLADIAIPVTVTLNLQMLDEAFEPARFFFMLAKRVTDERIPPRITQVQPSPFPALPGWGRPISMSDFLPGETLKDLDKLLARIDSQLMGGPITQRPAPHGGLSFKFDDPMVNMVVQVTPGPDIPLDPADPKGIELVSPTFGFLTPFEEAKSDTAVGMAPDTVYRVEALSSVGTTYVPIMRGTQNESGEYLIPNFDDYLWDQLRRAGYTPDQLAGHTAFTFRTGPFRITSPAHHGNTNAETAPKGLYTAQLQFARPAEGIKTPSLIQLRVAPRGRQPTTSVIPFPSGSSDSIQQDGFVRSEDVTKHAVPIQLPASNYDDLVEIEMQVFSGNSLADYLSRDAIIFHHDNIIPTVDPDADVTNTLESDGLLDQVCFVADCDVAGFIVQATNSSMPVMLSASEAERSACDANNRETFCFKNVSLGLPSLETDTKISVIAVDDQGNKSAPVLIDVRPRCQIFDKFVGPGGKLAAMTTTADHTPAVAWSIGSELVYGKASTDGSWPAQPEPITSLAAEQTFGLGIDLMLHPVDSEPVVCLVVAPEGAPSVTLGQLRVLKRTNVPSGFEWREIAHEDDVRPLGCSLTAIGNTVVVGWSGVDAARLGFVLGNGVLGTQNLPLPTGIVRANTVVWDVDVAAVGVRVYFTYRTANPLWNIVSAPGSIVAGYIEGTFRIAEDLSARPQVPFPQPAHTGFGPRIIADEYGVGLAYISAVETNTFDFESTRALEVMGAAHPQPGNPIVFGPTFSSSNPPPLGRLTADGVTRTSDGVAVPFGPPALVRGTGPDHRLVAGWSRAASFGTEEVAVASVDPTNGEATTAVLDRRVETRGLQRKERIAVHMAEGKFGYFMIFRNPSVSTNGRLVFANEQDHPITLPAGTFACAQAWQTAFIYPDELMLKYQRADVGVTDFYDSQCANLTAPLHRPYSAVGANGEFPEEIGGNESLLEDIVAGVFVENGRGLLKRQTNVCVPNAGVETCEQPTAPSNFAPTCVSSKAQPDRIQPALPSPTYRDETAGRLACQDGQLMKTFDDIGALYTCHRCPSGLVYDPSVRQCVGCSSGSVQYMPTGTVGQAPSTNDVRIISEYGLSVRCVGCESSDCGAANPSRGVMDWIPTADGELCTRCAGGSQLIECISDLQCNIFPNGRCAAAGWPSNGKRVCVQKCTTHSDCRGGYCDADGFCGDVNTQNEVPSGFGLLCRPIGCDECWQNSYCESSDDCPEAHTCSTGEPVKSPACIARPVLSKQFEATITQTISSSGKPDDIAKAKKVGDTLQLLRETVLRALRKVRLPWRFEYSGVSLTRLYPVGIQDVYLSITNGVLVLTIQTSKIEVDGDFEGAGFSASTPGPVKFGFAFALSTGISGTSSPPAENDSMSFSGLKLSTLSVGAEGLELDLPGPFNPDLSSLLLDDVGKYLGPVLDGYVSRAFRVIGGLREGTTGLNDQPDFLRCMFAREDPANSPFTHRAPTQCRDGAVPPIYNAALTTQGFELHYPRCEVTP